MLSCAKCETVTLLINQDLKESQVTSGQRLWWEQHKLHVNF